MAQLPIIKDKLGLKVFGAKMLHNVIDRAVQVHGALGVTEDTPLERMYRHARFARIYDGADEVHVQNTGGRILRRYANGEGFDFGLRIPRNLVDFSCGQPWQTDMDRSRRRNRC